MYLVTGGAGFFGELLVKRLLSFGHKVTSFDLNKPHFEHSSLRVIQGDIRDQKCIEDALEGVTTVFHNVAQVPVAKNKSLFWSVNRDGTEVLLKACLKMSIKRVVYTSSSAVFGVPLLNPVMVSTIPLPKEEYGKAKLAGESLCREYILKGLSCAIIRPRTVLGVGRLGIFQILFEWIYQGKNIPVLGRGDNIYQFVHGDDLASACIAAGEARYGGIYNIGTDRFGTMREVLESLVTHADTGSKVVSVPASLAEFGMNITSATGLSPLGSYHSLMYGKSMFFDTEESKLSLGFQPRYSNNEMFIDTYDWYCRHRAEIISGSLAGSKHQSAIKQGLLKIVPFFL